MVLKLKYVSESLGDRISGSVGLGWSQEFAFLPSSQVTLTLPVGIAFWEALTSRAVYRECCSAGGKTWLWFGTRKEISTYLIYLFSVILPVHISWVRFLCTLFVRPWKLTAGLHQRSEVLRALTSTSVKRARLRHPSCLVLCFFSPALATHCLPSLSQTGSQELREWVETSQRFLKRSLLLKRIPVWEQFSNCVLWNPGVPWGLSQGLRSFSLSPLPYHQVNQNSYTLIKNSFWGKLVWKKGSTAFIFNLKITTL